MQCHVIAKPQIRRRIVLVVLAHLPKRPEPLELCAESDELMTPRTPSSPTDRRKRRSICLSNGGERKAEFSCRDSTTQGFRSYSIRCTIPPHTIQPLRTVMFQRLWAAAAVLAVSAAPLFAQNPPAP